MCDLFSWKESKGKVYFLCDKQIKTKKGAKLFEEIKEDIIGHGAIQAYYKVEGINKEKNVYTDTYMLPKQIVKEFKAGNFKQILKYYDFNELINILTPTAQEEYNKITQSAWEEYNKIKQPALEEYNKITQPALEKYLKIEQSAQKEYLKIIQPAQKEYNKIEQSAWEKYLKIIQPAQEEYNKIEQSACKEYLKIKQPAKEEYNKIKQSAFWELFDNINNRIECWR